MKLIFLLQQSEINEKLKNAPDNGYAIGVWIGNLLPFVVLVGLAYWMYIKAKKRNQNE
ncbi:hypothetical protein GCM10011508_16310 [Flavobacterium lutivivi]|jgi:formate/nitrite transporter FocA (FNT family)|nr:hypothetical protein GCM10011508_16310 [Flavobacterium lutivivi]